jgi:hypothetical protein
MPRAHPEESRTIYQGLGVPGDACRSCGDKLAIASRLDSDQCLSPSAGRDSKLPQTKEPFAKSLALGPLKRCPLLLILG